MRKAGAAEKIRARKKGVLLSDSHRNAISEGMHTSEVFKIAMQSTAFKEKMRISKLGDKNPSWNNGSSFLPYSLEFTKELKRKIILRDAVCQLCGMTIEESKKKWRRTLCVNHINFDKKDCRFENLNVLCLSCNFKVNNNRAYYTDLFQKRMKEKLLTDL